MGNISLQIDEDLALLNFEAKDSTEVIKELGKRVLAKGYIEEEFIEKLLEREENFPTGLETACPFAIPHVGGFCNTSFLSFAVLKEPVIFNAMDGSGKELSVRCVFMFGITDPQGQVEVLKKFIFAFREEENLKKLQEMTDAKETLKYLKSLLGDGLEVKKIGEVVEKN